MRKHYYRRLFYLMALLFLCSCKLYQSRIKEDQRKERIQSHFKQQVDVVYKGLKDSQSRYWYFSSNSFFRFHPDSGLIGKNGQLAMLESKVNTSAQNEVSTNSSDLRLQTRHKLSTDKRNAWVVPNFWIMVFVLVALVMAWKFRFFLKTFLR